MEAIKATLIDDDGNEMHIYESEWVNVNVIEIEMDKPFKGRRFLHAEYGGKIYAGLVTYSAYRT